MKKTITATAVLMLLFGTGAAYAQSGTLGSSSSQVMNAFGRPMGGVSVAICQPLATTGAQVTSNIAVLTMAGNPIAAGFAPGMQVQVAGFSGADTYFNGGSFANGTGITGGYTILSVTSTTITYSLTHANASASSNGTVLQQGNATTSCAGLATVYSDAANQNAIAQPIATDGFGNWQAFTPWTGLYYVQFYGSTVTTQFRQVTALSSSNLNNIIYVDGVKYTTVQAAINAAGVGGTVVVPTGTWAQGSTPITDTGVSIDCKRGAIITFNGLGSSTDAVTIQGWSGTANYPVTVSGCTFRTSASGSASGQDGIQVSGGDHIKLQDLVLLDPGRDAIHVEPGCSNCWIENLTIDNVKTNLCSTNFPACSGSIAASGSLRDDLWIGLGEKFSTSLTGIYTNEISVNKGDLRAHARYGEHFFANNSCSGCSIDTVTFTDTHTDGAGRVPAATVDVYFEKGASGASNEINNISWLSGDSEDTVTSRSGPVFKASGASIGQGVNISAGWSYSNFASLMDVNFPADINNGVWFLYNASHVQTTPVAFWKDGTPSAAGSVGLFCPGGSQTSSLTFCSYNGGWAPGGFAAGLATKSSGYTLQYSDSWVNVTGTTTITVPHALTGQRWVVFNSGVGTVTVQADSGNINGGANITLAANTGKELTCDGTNCFAH